MRDELLNKSLFFGLDHVRQKLAAWTTDYTARQHSSLGYQTPAAYAAHLNRTGRPTAQRGNSAAQPVVLTEPKGVITNAETQVRAG